MTKKHKFIDTLKSWLLTLGVASVFGLAALGCNAAKSYEKASAYEYQDNGTYVFDFTINADNYSRDADTFFQWCLSYNDGNNFTLTGDFLIDVNGDQQVSDLRFVVDGTLSYQLRCYFYYEDLSLISLDRSTSEYSSDLIRNERPITLYYGFDNVGYQNLRNYLISYNVPQQSGNFLTALTDFMQILGGAIVQLAQPVANGVTEFARDLFIDNNHLSILGGVIGIFAGIALAVGITTKVYSWVTSLGN